MGLPFRDIVAAQELPWESLQGQVLAVDAYNAIYQFLATIRQRDGQPLTDRDGNPTSHLVGLFYRTIALLEQGVLPAYVFDGRPPDLKAGTLRARLVAKERAEEEWQVALAAGDLETARRKAAQTSRLTRPMVEEAKELLSALGIPSIQAPAEGEAQAAAMAAAGKAWAAASEDYDSLLFGAPRLVRGLAARGRRGSVEEGAQLVVRDELLSSLGISGEELILLGLIVGTDFNEGARGYGPKKGLKMVQQHLGWNATLAAVGLDPKTVEPAAELFRHPTIVEESAPVFGPVNDEAVERLLVGHHNFSADRVRAGIQRARHRPAPPTRETNSRSHQAVLDAFSGSEE